MSRPMSLDEIDQDAADFYTGRSLQALASKPARRLRFRDWEGQITERRQAALVKENRDD